MPSKDLIIDPATLDLDHPICGLEDIRRYNLQRHEMEQLTAIVHLDKEKNISVGYKDITDKEFWVRGHMPQHALMPAVIMCEAAAQLASYHTQKCDLLGAKVVGFGGLDEVSFRGSVFPGDRLVLAIELTRCRRGAMVVCRFQGFVKNNMVVDGVIKGIPLPIDNPRYDL
jgi:3-hydroxyacyl-[acyl-carrier-protein] dehydratase